MSRDTILITGALGYIGQRLVQELSKNHKLILTDVGMFLKDVDSVNDIRNKYNIPPRNICRLKDFLHTFDQEYYNIKTVIHLSGLSNDPMADFNAEANMEFNYIDTVNVCEFISHYKIPRLLYASSASVYGTLDTYVLAESAPTKGESNYARSKLASEKYIEEYFKDSTDTRYTIFRKATVMGCSPRMRFDLVVNTMVKDAMTKGVITLSGGGKNWRPLVAIEDVVETYKFFSEIDDDSYMRHSDQVYNVVKENWRISELALYVKDYLSTCGVKTDINPQFDKPLDVRSYRILGHSLTAATGRERHYGLGGTILTVFHHIQQMLIKENPIEDDIYYNIRWLKGHPYLVD